MKLTRNNFKNKKIGELTFLFSLIKMITTAFIFIIVILLAITMHKMVTEDVFETSLPFFIIVIGCSATLPIQFINMKNIKTELKLRKGK
jgi:amino acid permease